MPELNPAPAPPAPTGLCKDYRPPAGVYDEMCSVPGTPRPHWEYLMRSLGGLGVPELERRRQEARRLLRENGVTYNVYDDPQGNERPWALDPIPVLLTSREWSPIERGLIQRAELLDLVLADLYGPRQLLRKGLLPPELVYTHSGFLRPCVGLQAPMQRHLQLYAADLGRAPDGSVRVIGDRTQVPSGTGYALENRIVLSRVLPSLYRDSHVHRLALFFRSLRSLLAQTAPRPEAEPRVVLLTPGPGNETYFEHAYLASYLGYTLAQGGDLTVRDSRVWLKTLERLQPVDVVLRRVDDTFCDPLELRGESLLGVPGLLQSARAGHVGIANPLGSGVLENPALLAFLPALCRALLGEELALPSVQTWWCGIDKDREHVLANLARLVIKPVFPHPNLSTLFGRRLRAEQREALTQRIRTHPHLFVGQEEVPLSTAPVLATGRLDARPVVVRSFLVARDDTYVVMPGGLGRVSGRSDDPVVSNQRGGISKDLWILASEPEQELTLLPPVGRPLPLSRSGGEVPSRVADDLFWLGRYAERAESSARLLREILLLRLQPDSGQQDAVSITLLRALTPLTGVLPGCVGEGAERRCADPEPELLALIRDGRYPGSLHGDVVGIVHSGRSVRDRLSRDGWRIINSLEDELNRPTSLSEGLDSLERLLIALAAFAGMSAESMTRGQGRRFLELGRRIERALRTVSLLRATLVATEAPGVALWEALLAVTDSIKTYRRRYRSQLELPAVLDLLLHDESNPRSLGFQVAALQDLVAGLPRRRLPPHRSTEERLVLEALTALRLSEVEELLRVGQERPLRERLDQLLAWLSHLLAALSDALGRSYFSHTELPKQLGQSP